MNNLNWKYIKNLKNGSLIDEFEKKYNIFLPTDLKECILKNNGGRPSQKRFNTIKSSGRCLKSLLSYNEDDIENIYKVYPLNDSVHKNLLPFASDQAGNLLCIDLLKNCIVLWLHETDTTELVSNSFTDLLNSLY